MSDIDAANEFFVRAFTPEFRADPYSLYAQERAQHDVADTGIGVWFAFTHHACSTILRSPIASSDERHSRMFQNEAAVNPRLAEMAERRPPLVFLDPPDHTRLRQLVAQAFTPSVIAGLRDRIGEVTIELLNGIADQGSAPFDLISMLAYPLPITVICELLGVPIADRDVFSDWSRDLARGVDPSVLRSAEVEAAIEAARAAIEEYLSGLLARRRITPGDDLLTALLAVEDAGDRLAPDELLDLAVLLLVAGHETTVNLIGNGVRALLQFPAEAERWRRDPALGRNAIDELLRFDSPVQFVQRVAIEPIELAGNTIAPGDSVIPILGSANRDPEAFADPDRLDITRVNANRHVAFGGGIHHCLGAALARAEGEIAVGALLQRFPRIELVEEPQPRPTFTLRGLERLVVRTH